MSAKNENTRQGKILIVDDEPGIRDTLGKILKKAGFYVETAMDYRTVQKAIKNLSFDIIIMDIILPRMNGIEMLQKIREEFEEFDSAVIFFTGEPNINTILGAIRQGAYDYLEKPIGRDKLLSSIKLALKNRKRKIAVIEKNKQTILEVDKNFLNSANEDVINDYKIKTKEQLEKIYEALFTLKKQYGEKFSEEQRNLLNIIATENNKMRRQFKEDFE